MTRLLKCPQCGGLSLKWHGLSNKYVCIITDPQCGASYTPTQLENLSLSPDQARYDVELLFQAAIFIENLALGKNSKNTVLHSLFERASDLSLTFDIAEAELRMMHESAKAALTAR